MPFIKNISVIADLLINASPRSYVSVNTGKEIEAIPDFREINLSDVWKTAQEEYIRYHEFYKKLDNEEHFKKEIDSVKGIYRDEFQLSGRILDVGGGQGRLRHFLNNHQLENYICIDPFPEAMDGFGKMKNMLSAYNNINEPMYFMAAFAEKLPFKDAIFDWVHMRSVLDHFEDPVKAIQEAKRVLKPGGKLLIGVSIKKGNWLKSPDKPFIIVRVLSKIKRTLSPDKTPRYKTGADDHVHEWSYEELISLISDNGFTIEKEHRQKSPWQNVIYISAVS